MSEIVTADRTGPGRIDPDYPDYIVARSLALRDLDFTLRHITDQLRLEFPNQARYPSRTTIMVWCARMRPETYGPKSVEDRELAILHAVDEMLADDLEALSKRDLIALATGLRNAHIRRNYIRLQIAATVIRTKADLEHNTEIRELVEELERTHRNIVDASSSPLP